jgi:outer membrane lipoprotein-sorting protein
MSTSLSARWSSRLYGFLMLLLALATMGLPPYALPGGATPSPTGTVAPVAHRDATQPPAPPAQSPGDEAAQRGVEEILARHYEAIGGDHHQQIQTMKITGRSIAMGMEAPYARWSKRPNKVLLEIYVEGMTGIQAFDGETAWGYMPFMGQTSPAALPPQQTQAVLEDADFDGPLVHAHEKGHRVELRGIAPVAGRDAYELEITLQTGGVQTHWFDVETFRVTRVVSAEGDATFLDYRLFDGHPVPSVIELMGAMGEQTIYVDDVEFDVAIDDAAFRMK